MKNSVSRVAKLFIVYFPVTLVFCQVLVNLMTFVWPEAYYAAGFYLNLFFGTNVLFAIFLVAFCFMFRMCSVSRWAACAELLFAVNYMIVKEDNLYNIMFQVIVGVLALVATFWHYIKKFPLCNMSLVLGFVKRVVQKGSCKKGYEMWTRDVTTHILRQQRKHQH